jgi:glutamine synthetase
MSTFRFQALKEAYSHQPIQTTTTDSKLSSYFGQNVFNDEAMRQHLTKEAYQAVVSASKEGTKIDRKIADQVASGMKDWAMAKGVKHYTHWFQPLTGATAEKHDSFFEVDSDGRGIEKFTGGLLTQQEPDASSFPNGGIRNTFEARGYTAWDPSSPAFIIGDTLCIPTVFVAYTGEALDNKTPLLRAVSALDEAATDVAKYFDKNVSKVITTLGCEQEYFLIDSALYNSRPDLLQTGRTLLGHSPAKGQQLDDHYFGSIPSRALEFMKEVELESVKLGIPLKTRHNEVAPNQFEFAPVFEEVNLANDHNSLFMDVIDKTARKHNFKALFHEKPYAGINGSGKHNNWSMSTNTGVNLLSPGKTPKSNLQFLTFFINTIKAVSRYPDLIRASIASASNDHRLGANEAPPAIISIFIGSQLTKVLNDLENVTDGKLSPEEKTELKLNVVGKIPEILLDNTDRNRTSPFAFTGNKFEFRAVGSDANSAGPMTVLNAIVTKQLKEFKATVDKLIEDGLKKDDAIFNVLRDYIKESRYILFEGDGYSDEWVEEALSRGLKNNKLTPEALIEIHNEETIELFEESNILTRVEFEARQEIQLEEYTMRIQIESRVLGDLARNHVIPTAIKYQNLLTTNIKDLKDIFGDDYKNLAKEQIDIIKKISERISIINSTINEMIEKRKEINPIEDIKEKSLRYAREVKPMFDVIRYHCDKLELTVDDEMWPLTKYREMLFAK